MGLILWVVAISSALALLWLGMQLFAIAFKRWLPFRVAITESVTLGETKTPKSTQVYATVRYTCEGQSDTMHVAFWSSNKARIERSGRYKRLQEFYSPGKSFRVHEAHIGGATNLFPRVRLCALRPVSC